MPDVEFCPEGCGCRKGTEDADANDCGCDGPCCYDIDWGPDEREENDGA